METVEKMQKRVVTLQDISCFGKCSITVALPTISAMGLACSVIPTAVLSTHTGGFKGFTFRDLTEDITPIAEHWQREGIVFDGIYTGYLGSRRQIDLVSRFIDMFRMEDTLVFVDPAMADNGKLYTGFDMEFVDSMKKLCSKADFIVPNITEAAMLLGIGYRHEGYDERYIHTMLTELCKLGAKRALLTGVSYDGENQGVVAYDSTNDTFSSYFAAHIDRSSHGTGDVFASSFFGGLMLGIGVTDAMKIAVDFTVESIKATLDDTDHWYGVKFETALPGLMENLKKIQNPYC